MAGGSNPSARELDQTPTWAVGLVCAVIVIISILLEKVLHHIGEYFERKHKEALFEALQKIKGELMVLGFISLLLTFGQNYIAEICIPEEYAYTMLPCEKREPKYKGMGEHKGGGKRKGGGELKGGAERHRRLLWNEHRILAGGSSVSKCPEGYLPLISVNGLHQLHIFIFFLAVFHAIYSAITMLLGRAKVCFFRQFFRSVRKADYLTLRHGFISVHLAPGSKFDFQKYIKRSLEDDFKIIVGISPVLWTSAVLFLTLNVDGWQAMFWLSVMPLFVILSVGTKLQAIITQMAVEIQERHAVVQGIPLVQVSDRYFWFSWPRLVLHLIHLTLFQNAFEITYFFWIWYEFGLYSCFHEDILLQYVRICIGVGILVLCSYITLPLYALVTQMGSTMKKSIFDQQTSKALMSWHKNALNKKADGKPATTATRTLGDPSDSPHNSPEHPHIRDMNNNAGQTANIVATVDITGENPPSDGNYIQSGNHTLL